MLRRVLLVALTALAPLAPAAGADLPNRYSSPEVFSGTRAETWTGFYVGAQLGYAWATDQTRIDIPGFPLTFSGPDHDIGGAVGGVHAGYTFQTGLAIFGVEGDLELAGIDGAVRLEGSGGFSGYGLTSSTDIGLQGSVRGRVGFAMLDHRLMLYGTAGLAFANVENTYAVTLPPGNIFGASSGTASVTFDETRWGWTVGAGAEYALMTNWTARFEYRYTNLSAYKNAAALLASGAASEQDPDFHTLRIGASYRF